MSPTLPSRLFFILVIITLVTTSSSAQVTNALKKISKGELSGIETDLRTGLSDEEERPLAYYGLAALYAHPDYPQRQLDSAYVYTGAAEEAYKALDYKTRGKVNKDLPNTTTEIRKLRTAILKDALAIAEEENSLKGWQHFIDHYPGSGSRYEGKAVLARNQLAFEAAADEDTEAAYEQLLTRYGPELRAKNPDLYRKAQERHFERYLARNGWSAYAAFAEQFPDNVYVRDSLFDTFRGLWGGPAIGYSDFIADYGDAPMVRFAVDSLAANLAQEADSLLSPVFIERYPAHPQHDLVYGQWYESIRHRFNSLSQLEMFKEAHPNFPYPERWAEDEDRLLHNSYDKLQVGKALGAFRAFIDRHPNYSRIDSVWWRYYLTFKQELPGYENLKKFEKVHPDFPFPEALAADKAGFMREEQANTWQRLQESEGTGALFKFTGDNPESPYFEQAVDLLGERLSTMGEQRQLEAFLDRYPNHQRRPDLLLRLWALFPDKEDYDALARFVQDYPDFPEPELIQQAIQSVPLTAEELQNFEESKRLRFENYIRLRAPEESAFEALWVMISTYFPKEDWDAAYGELRSYADVFGDENEEYSRWMNIFSPENRIQKKSISPKVNSPLQEYMAIITTDDQTMYFCRNVADNGFNEDIYVSRRDAQGNWQEAEPVKDLITSSNEAPETVSADGNRMFTFFNGKICLSEKTRDGWTTPVPLSSNINQNTWQADARVTADGNGLIFTSRKPDGDKDLYISLRQEDGSWGPAISLGDDINTPYDDRAAFLHPDMKTLYFSSMGHRGLGRLDVFVSKRLNENSWTEWSKPINLGLYINSPQDDWSFKVTTDGRQGYYNVQSLDAGGDIYIMPLPKEFQPDPVATVSGQLIGAQGSPIDAHIDWVNLQTGEKVQTTTSDPTTGNFFATLPSLGRYSYTIKKQGYFPISGTLDFTEKLFHLRLDKQLTVNTIEEMREQDLAIPLNNLFFETAKYDIKTESYPELNGLAEWIQENDLAIEIHGHTDNVGEEEANRELSDNRARAVREYLISKGVPANRIESAGFGESRPIADNNTAEGRALNRRVEIKLVSGG